MIEIRDLENLVK